MAELIELLVEGARYGDLEDVQSAIDQGVDVNSQDEHGRTGALGGHGGWRPGCSHDGAQRSGHQANARQVFMLHVALHGAAANGHQEVLELLLSRGAVSSRWRGSSCVAGR